MTRGPQGRRIGRVLIAVAVGLIVEAGFAWVAAPGFMGGGLPEWQTTVITFVAVVGVVVGLAWMIRIHRADPEPDQRAWRYRRFG